MDILGIERLAAPHFPSLETQGRGWRLLHLIEPDGRFQHQEHVKSLFANVLHYIGDLL